MASEREEFWTHSTYAIVGDSSRRKFPLITYRALKKAGKTVYAVDPGNGEIEGDKAYPDLKYLPGAPDGIVLEVPKDRDRRWVRAAVEAGIKNVWIHQQTETPEALAAARGGEHERLLRHVRRHVQRAGLLAACHTPLGDEALEEVLRRDTEAAPHVHGGGAWLRGRPTQSSTPSPAGRSSGCDGRRLLG